MKRRILPLLAAAALLAGCFSGCAGTGVRSYTGSGASPSPSAEPRQSVTVETLDYDAAYAKYDPDTVVMTIDGLTVTWQEYYYWLYYYTSAIESNLSQVVWTEANTADSSVTNQGYVLAQAELSAAQYRAIEHNAASIGAELDEEDEASLEQMWQDEVTNYGNGDEAYFISYLESIYLSRELDTYFNRVSLLYSAAFETMYGENGANLSDEDTLAYAEENGYMHVKHILVSGVDEEGLTLPEDQLAEKRATAEDLLGQLQAVSGDQAALETLFDHLAEEYSEDTGKAYYPDGYVFTQGKMVEEFESAAQGLDLYGLSGIVETDYGFHIILRLPLSPDDVVEYYSEDEVYTLRYLAAWNMYNATVDNWLSEARIVYSEGFENLDLSGIFDTFTAPDAATTEG